jgi:hypothetical protein
MSDVFQRRHEKRIREALDALGGPAVLRVIATWFRDMHSRWTDEDMKRECLRRAVICDDARGKIDSALRG